MPRTAAPSSRAHAADRLDGGAPQLRVADDAALAGSRSRPTSNCGLTIARQSNRGAAAARTAGSTFASEMNDTSIRQELGAVRQLLRRERARVRPFDHGDARVLAQAPVELAVRYVQRDDVVGAALQQAVREPARGRADVEAAAPVHGHPEGVERVRQLDAAARDERRLAVDVELDLGVHELPGLVGAAAARAQVDVAGQHRRRGARA